MKRILTIQDISCVGKCSLTVALPIISAMQLECCVLPTAVLSTHTAFKGFTFRDLTDDIKPIQEHWKKENIAFDSIYTGYLGSFRQLKLVENLIKEFGTQTNKIIIDPVMADNGKLYPGFTQDFAFSMAELCSKADLILPNLTEACFMLGVPYPGEDYDEEFIKNLLIKLSGLGAKTVLIKGVSTKKDYLGIVSYNSKEKKFNSYFHQKLDAKFHGTGDIFASCICGAITNGKSLEVAIKIAADFTVQSICATLKDKNSVWYGVNFEQALPQLIKEFCV